ncbi:uncharacterized protein LOC134649046 [Cydia amplana]|uniref:uncharacterized protein LOC134649046 n=1 Tax=Cydia amplana TaxID=1869771 RepID=UPI002FE538AF
MSLRTPRRRISPRARRRYRAIKNFFRRTLSSLTSLSGNKINSSTTENVNNLNRSDMMGHQLHAVPHNCHGLHSVGNIYRHSEDLTPREGNGASSPKQRRRRFSEQEFIPNGPGTKVLYKPADNLCRNSHECGLTFYNDYSNREQHSSDRINYGQCSSSHDVPNQKLKKIKRQENFNRRGSRLRKRGAPIILENSISGFDSYDSLTTPLQKNPCPTYREPIPQNSAGYSRQQEYARDVQPDVVKIKRRRDKSKRHKSKSPHTQERRKRKKNEPLVNEEQQFIADIINRQYKPLSFFGRIASDISQISTPVCRDHRYSAREMVIPDSEVSSFSRGPAGGGRHGSAADVRDMRSLCDTRLCSAPWPARQRRRRAENYNDSNLYDVVPVKEKTSPKSRRKFIEDNLIMNEVPPSPRTHRPRLILKTQNYSEYEDYEQPENQIRKRRSPSRRPEYEYMQTFRHDLSTEESPRTTNEMSRKFARRPNNTVRLHDDMGTTMSSQQYITSQDNTANNTLNNSKTHDRDDTVVDDKTDKALCEIKGILQSFLQELKKDSSTSQCDRVSGSDKNSGKQLDGTLRGSDNETSNAMKNSAGSSLNCGLGQGCTPAMAPPFMPGFANPCCYPQMIPMYGAHGIPYLVASPSCVCANVTCGHSHPRPQTDTRDAQCRTCSKVNCTEAEATKSNCETDVLIREIYNYVARNPTICKESKSSQDQGQSPKRKPSVGKSMHALHQDANVGTPPLRCYSKSCEAIASRQHFDTYYATYPSYSDSLLEERISREAVTDYQMPRETNEYNFNDKRAPNHLPKQHSQDSKFTSALRLLRKSSKKNRKENIHEVCLSEPSIEVDVMPKGNNFKQEFASYAMHGQEFLRPPPLRHDPRFPPTYDYDYSPYNSPMTDYSGPRPLNDRYNRYDCMPPEGPVMYDNSYEQCSHATKPQVPLCLKEVEVRSIGTQSEKKTTFRMFSQKKQRKDDAVSPPPRPLVSILRDDRRTDTKIPDKKPENPRKLFNLKPKAAASKSEPMAALTDKIQKDLTKNDKTMTNAMLRKLFYKRNPFSPQNRFVRTIMEKDTPTYKWRPRLFL